MLTSAALVGLVAAAVLPHNMRKAQGASGWLKAKHCLLLGFLLLIHSASLARLSWMVFHLTSVDDEFYKTLGVFRPWQTFLVVVVSDVAGTALLFIGINVASRRMWARRALLRLLPFTYLLDSLTVYVGFAKNGDSGAPHGLGGFVLVQVAFAAVFGWIYVLTFLFYRSGKANVLFDTNEGRADSGPPPPPLPT